MIAFGIKLLLKERMAITNQKHRTGDIRNCIVSSTRRKNEKEMMTLTLPCMVYYSLFIHCQLFSWRCVSGDSITSDDGIFVCL